MIELSVELRQDDCPFIETTVAHDVSFSTVHWEFDQVRDLSESRVVMEGREPGNVDEALSDLADHPTTRSVKLLSRQGSRAHIHSRIAETDAMKAVRSNAGYITGPFHTRNGSETWHISFDREAHADASLSALDRNNELEVLERKTVTPETVDDFVENVGAAMTLIEGARELSDVERRTLEEAVNKGYFSRPRSVDLGDLAAEFDVSKPAVSKNLRRGQEKLLERVVEALNDLR